MIPGRKLAAFQSGFLPQNSRNTGVFNMHVTVRDPAKSINTRNPVESRAECYPFNVRVRGEESVARTLREKGYEVLLPTYIQKRRYSDRIKKISCALFPGYVFAYTTMDAMMGILATPGAHYVVRSGTKITSLSPEDEQTVRALCLANAECEPCNHFQLGLRVLIEEGPLAGLTGTLAKVRNSERVIISVESVQRSIMVEIGRASLRVLQDQPQDLSAWGVGPSQSAAIPRHLN
jgi:transcriptional antiterminator RfaH